jgi:hypothetical protein
MLKIVSITIMQFEIGIICDMFFLVNSLTSSVTVCMHECKTCTYLGGQT